MDIRKTKPFVAQRRDSDQNGGLTGIFCLTKRPNLIHGTIELILSQTQRNCCTSYAESPARNSILLWVHNFDEQGMVENAKRSRKPGALSNQKKSVSNHFVPYLSRCSQRAGQDLNIPRSAAHDSLRNKLHMFLYKLQVLQHLNDRD